MTKPSKISRFSGQTAGIDIGRLERETLRLLLFGFVLSILFHGSIAVLFTVREFESPVPKSFAVELIIKPPRMKKPFAIRQRRLSERPFQRRQSLLNIPPTFPLANMNATPGILPSSHEFVDSISIRMESKFEDFADSNGSNIFRERFLPEIGRIGDNLSLRDEGLRIDDLDIGRYKSIVMRKQADRKSISGFVYIPVNVWSAELKPIERPVIGLVEALKKYTSITPKLDGHLMLGSPILFSFPFIYISTDEEFELNDVEHEAFTRYLSSGGFAMLDNGFPQDTHSDAEASLRKMLGDAARDIGSDAHIIRIPSFHPLYHSFFDFDTPPLGAELLSETEFNINKNVVDREYYHDRFLEGLWIGTRLAAVYSDHGYGLRWMQLTNNEPQQKIGVNIVVYALTHEGGINRRQEAPTTALR